MDRERILNSNFKLKMKIEIYENDAGFWNRNVHQEFKEIQESNTDTNEEPVLAVSRPAQWRPL